MQSAKMATQNHDEHHEEHHDEHEHTHTQSDNKIHNHIMHDHEHNDEITSIQERDKKEQEAIQQKYMNLQLLGQQSQQLTEQLQAIEQQMMDVAKLKQNVQELSLIPPNTESISAVGSGLFIKTELKETKNFIVGVGAGVLVKKSAKEVEKLLDEQRTELQQVHTTLAEQLQHTTIKAQKLQEELQHLFG